jgi:hypothetical protein
VCVLVVVSFDAEPSGPVVVASVFDFDSVSDPNSPSRRVVVCFWTSIERLPSLVVTDEELPDEPRAAMQALRSVAVDSDAQSESFVVVLRVVVLSLTCAKAGVAASNNAAAKRCGRIQSSNAGLTCRPNRSRPTPFRPTILCCD